MSEESVDQGQRSNISTDKTLNLDKGKEKKQSITEQSVGQSHKEKRIGQSHTEKTEGQSLTEKREGQSRTEEREGGQSRTEEREGQSRTEEREGGQSVTEETEGGQSRTEERVGHSHTEEREGQSVTEEREGGQSVTEEREEGQSRTEEREGGQSHTEEREGQSVTEKREGGQSHTEEREGQSHTEEREGQSVTEETEGGQSVTEETEGGQSRTEEREEKQRRTKEKEEGQSRAENYCQFLEYILKNYRFGLIMQTSLTVVLAVCSSLLWPPVHDVIKYQVLNYPKPPELDPSQVINFMERHQQNSECNFTEIEERYTSLLRNYSALEKDMSALQLNYTELNGKLVEHEEKIANTSTLLEPIGQNVTEIKGKLQLQSERTNRVQKDIDTNMLRQIAEDFFLQYMWIILAFGEICLALYMFRLKSKLGDRGRQPTAVVQSTEAVKRVDTNEEDGHNNRPRSVLNGTFRTSTDNSVCVLSFNRDPAHKKHVQLSKSFLDEEVKVTDVVIQGEGDIPNIPPSKVVLVHVDFNARNIILENPEREIGELRRTTVQALWRMKADVILLYYYEERSAKPLGDQDLYSSDLESVRNQAELKRLEEQNRFISLNGQLSERQRQHLREVVKKKIETTPA